MILNFRANFSHHQFFLILFKLKTKDENFSLLILSAFDIRNSIDRINKLKDILNIFFLNNYFNYSWFTDCRWSRCFFSNGQWWRSSWRRRSLPKYFLIISLFFFFFFNFLFPTNQPNNNRW